MLYGENLRGMPNDRGSLCYVTAGITSYFRVGALEGSSAEDFKHLKKLILKLKNMLLRCTSPGLTQPCPAASPALLALQPTLAVVYRARFYPL